MNQQTNSNISTPQISVDQYLELLNKPNLTPDEIIKKQQFESFINLCQVYEQFLSVDAQSILAEYTTKKNAYNKNTIKASSPDLPNLPKLENVLTNEEEGPVRKLSKAGYIDSAVILIVLLNIGFIVAITFLRG